MNEDTTGLTVEIESKKNKDELHSLGRRYSHKNVKIQLSTILFKKFEQIFVTINEAAEVNQKFRYC